MLQHTQAICGTVLHDQCCGHSQPKDATDNGIYGLQRYPAPPSRTRDIKRRTKMQQSIEKAGTKAETILIKLVECGKLLPGSLDRVRVLVLDIPFSSPHQRSLCAAQHRYQDQTRRLRLLGN